MQDISGLILYRTYLLILYLFVFSYYHLRLIILQLAYEVNTKYRVKASYLTFISFYLN